MDRFNGSRKPRRRRGWAASLALVAMLVLLGLRTGHAQPAGPQAELSFAPASFPTGTVSSTATGCLAAGYGDADNLEADVYVAWSGTVTSAKLVGDEFNVNWRSDIYLNNTLIGQSILDPTGATNGTYCTPYPGATQEWAIDPSLVQPGLNRIRLTAGIRPNGLPDEWGTVQRAPGAAGRDPGWNAGNRLYLH